ncbi:outer membrane efflux protein [Caballeronia hypogeia]|uniref:Outer membrane efflux protein n=1 Tax=Caballeronia hypogeia TaxID=1777140 RepID=A0A158A5I5_9BURK|nr:TolC family protein [Caballeronia hypogeia]SAK52357.1 outer membrane efflux protein [Caballeronia hypogeia]
MLVRTLAALLFLVATSQTAAEPVLAPADVNAQAERKDSALTLDYLLSRAAAANPSLRAARAGADASRGTLVQAGASPNPDLSLLQEGFSSSERTSTALLSQRIELGGKRGARLDVASYGRQAALASLDVRDATLRAQVITAFYGLLAARRQLQVAAESADLAQRSVELADKRVRAGKVSPIEADKARVAEAGAQIELARARAQTATQAERLSTITGVLEVRDRGVAGDIETLPTAETLAELLARADAAPLVRAAKAQMLRSNAAISVERSKRMPDITVSAGMKRSVTGGVSMNQAVVGVSIPLPIFDTNKGGLLEAVHQAEQAEAEFDNETANLRLELASAYSTYRNAADEAQRLKSEVLPAARNTFNAMSRGFELGKFAFLEVLDAQRTLYQEQSRYVQALSEAHLAYAELGRLAGTPLPSSSFAGPSPLIAQP